MEEIVLLGGGGHAQSVADTVERMGTYRIIGYTDIKKNGVSQHLCWYAY